jgi:hypothetical protein
MEDPGHIDSDDLVPPFGWEILHIGGELDAGVVDQDINRTQSLRGIRNHGGDLVRLTDIRAAVSDLHTMGRLHLGTLIRLVMPQRIMPRHCRVS